jgi:hypothetical protein
MGRAGYRGGGGGDHQPIAPDSRRALEAVNPDLPLVVKYRGRWVVKFLSDLPERCDQE